MSERGWQFVTELNYYVHIHHRMKKDASSHRRRKNKDFDSIHTNSNAIAAYILTDRRILLKEIRKTH